MKKIIYFLLAIIYIVIILYLFLPKGVVNDEGSLDLFFCKETNCSYILTQLIQNSNEVKCVFYDLGEPNVLNSLNQSKVEVLLFEENYFKVSDYNFIPVKSDGLMHHKFCIFDEKIVLTGSWNPTIRGTYLNDNLVLIIVSEKMSDAYLDEYNKIKKGKQNIGNYKFNISGMKVDLCFSPQGNCENLIIDVINNAKNEIKYLTFTFTSFDIANAIISKNKIENIFYEGIMEKSKISQYSVNKILENVILDNNKYNMHHKSFIIDNNIVILGSYNPTKGANTINDENVLVIESFELNKLMRKEYNRISLY